MGQDKLEAQPCAHRQVILPKLSDAIGGTQGSGFSTVIVLVSGSGLVVVVVVVLQKYLEFGGSLVVISKNSKE